MWRGVLTGSSTRTPKGVRRLRRPFPWAPVTSDVMHHFFDRPSRSLLVVMFALAAGAAHACTCGPDYENASDIYAIEVLRVDPVGTSDAPEGPGPSLVSYRVITTLRGAPHVGGTLRHAGHGPSLCGPPMHVGRSFIWAFSRSDQNGSVHACELAFVLNNEDIERVRKSLERKKK